MMRCDSTAGGERLDVVGQRVVAAVDERVRLGGAQQHQAGARARRPARRAGPRACARSSATM